MFIHVLKLGLCVGFMGIGLAKPVQINSLKLGKFCRSDLSKAFHMKTSFAY